MLGGADTPTLRAASSTTQRACLSPVVTTGKFAAVDSASVLVGKNNLLLFRHFLRFSG